MAVDTVYGIDILETTAGVSFVLPQTTPTYTYDTNNVTYTLKQYLSPNNVVLDSIPLTVTEDVVLPSDFTKTLSGKYFLTIDYINVAGILISDEYLVIFKNYGEL